MIAWETVSPRGARDIPANEFFTGLWENSMASDEILTAVQLPVWGAQSGFAVEEFARRHGDFAIAGAAVAVELDDNARVSRCGIGLLGLGHTPLRGSPAEQAVLGRLVGDITADELGQLAISSLAEIPADLQGSAAYGTKVGVTMVPAPGNLRPRRQPMHEWPVHVSVNGQPTEASVEPRLTLGDYLREKCGLTGTHLGCEHGACGACTVLRRPGRRCSRR